MALERKGYYLLFTLSLSLSGNQDDTVNIQLSSSPTATRVEKGKKRAKKPAALWRMITHIMRNTATVATDGATSNDRVTKSNLLKFNQISEYLILKMYNVLVKKRYNINVKEAIDKRYSWNCLP